MFCSSRTCLLVTASGLELAVLLTSTALPAGSVTSSTLLTVKLQQLAGKKQTMTEEEQKKFQAPILAKYDEEGSAYY